MRKSVIGAMGSQAVVAESATIIEMPEAKKYSVAVTAHSTYLPDQSDEEEDRYVFAYTIRITNNGSVTAQLVSRHWIITDADNQVQEVRGMGVVGEQPVLKPGDTFEYSSGSSIPTAVGTMRGSYQLVADDGTRFEAQHPGVHAERSAHPALSAQGSSFSSSRFRSSSARSTTRSPPRSRARRAISRNTQPIAHLHRRRVRARLSAIVAIAASRSRAAPRRPPTPAAPASRSSARRSRRPLCPAPATPPTPTPPAPPVDYRGRLQPASWIELPDWRREPLRPALEAFVRGCAVLEKQDAWKGVCAGAQTVLAEGGEADIAAFFELNFDPYQVINADDSTAGMVTGYYEPLLHGSRVRTARYRYPLYARAAGPARDRPRVGLSGPQEPAPARQARRQPRRALLRARRHRPRCRAAQGPRARRGWTMRSTRSSCTSRDPARCNSRTASDCAWATPTRTGIRSARSEALLIRRGEIPARARLDAGHQGLGAAPSRARCRNS